MNILTHINLTNDKIFIALKCYQYKIKRPTYTSTRISPVDKPVIVETGTPGTGQAYLVIRLINYKYKKNYFLKIRFQNTTATQYVW